MSKKKKKKKKKKKITKHVHLVWDEDVLFNHAFATKSGKEMRILIWRR